MILHLKKIQKRDRDSDKVKRGRGGGDTYQRSRKKIYWTGKSETKNLENLTDGLTFQCFNFRENTHISSIFRRLSLSHFWSFLDNSFTYVAM